MWDSSSVSSCEFSAEKAVTTANLCYRHSNAIPCNPKALTAVQPQFEELLAALDIPTSLSGKDKIARLRALDAETLSEAVKDIQMKTFRPVADGAFFPDDLMRRFAEGEFAREFERRGMKVLLGEVMNEVRVHTVAARCR